MRSLLRPSKSSTVYGLALLFARCRQVFEAGVCGCHGYDLTQGDDYLKIFEMLVFMEELMVDSDEDTKRKMVATLCSSLTNDGDQLQVSAAS